MQSLRYDLTSSLVVFLVALPLCLGVALASGAPLYSGLIAGVIGGVIVGLLGASNFSVAGPAAGLTVIVASGIQTLGSFQGFCLALVLAGLLQFIFGLAGLHRLMKWISESVIEGMLAAIGIIIFFKELPYLFGVKTLRGLDFNFSTQQWACIIVSFATVGSIWGWDKMRARQLKSSVLPASLIGVMTGAIVLAITAEIMSFVPSTEIVVTLPSITEVTFAWPQLKLLDLRHLQIALVMALVASIETLLNLEASQTLIANVTSVSAQKELLAQGLGNTISGLLGGIPITSVIVRSAANIEAGARSRLSTIFHGLWLMLFVVLFSDQAKLIPLASLAVILMMVGYKLFSPKIFRLAFKKGKLEFLTFITTLMTILIFDLLIGVAAGVALNQLLQNLKRRT